MVLEETADGLFLVTENGKPISPTFQTEDEALRWVEKEVFSIEQEERNDRE